MNVAKEILKVNVKIDDIIDLVNSEANIFKLILFWLLGPYENPQEMGNALEVFLHTIKGKEESIEDFWEKVVAPHLEGVRILYKAILEVDGETIVNMRNSLLLALGEEAKDIKEESSNERDNNVLRNE